MAIRKYIDQLDQVEADQLVLPGCGEDDREWR